MKVKGHNVLRYPHASIEEFKAKPGSVGIPFLAPWANRLDEQAFYANGKEIRRSTWSSETCAARFRFTAFSRRRISGR